MTSKTPPFVLEILAGRRALRLASHALSLGGLLGLLGLVGAGALAPGCATTTSYDYKSEPDPRKSEFVIGPVDLLRITVWKNAELSTDARVRPDGTITMPLIGDVRAAGRTPSDLRAEIEKQLAAYLNADNRRVTVAVVDVNSYRFTVGGNVERAGVYSSRNYVTVVEAIALAGGLNRFANEHHIVLLRGTPVRRIPIDFARISAGEHPEENLALMPGDTISVP